ncbi:CRISPR-associated protein, Cmr2 family [Laceyella tengchongensis]|uniref:CRISPR-associated protein, Cmr2 family n=1 Tax=Laceyella tengchongensis TaxID=574699 RepID=A0AA45WPB8_9BACL|nr:type III-B CRISPR-associated protein Cas10/Cmr2 [Laceyella tengchongensis]SMP21005.1 CRISPR-associated protein, Cmr2 family [Laceyella tengchongensis]
MSGKYFHFTIGPVQGFVAQSRRTRDLLASSFLLSYLSGHAMAAVMDQGGSIVFPDVHDQYKQIHNPLLQAINQTLQGKELFEKPWIGSLPNRFKASILEGFQPQKVEEAVQRAWIKIADTVWTETVSDIAVLGNGTREIWERQVHGWWEMAWVIGDDPTLLNLRKNWRSYIPTIEPGDKCTLMPQLQELSGYVRSRHRQQQDIFWHSFHENQRNALDLRERERLSAIALIKRFYPLYAKKAIGWELPSVAVKFPPTTYLAAFPTILRMLEKSPEQAKKFASIALKSSKNTQTVALADHFPLLQRKAEKDVLLKKFIQLDGNVFFPRWAEKDVDAETFAQLKPLYLGLSKEPSPYYAILLMDGDQLGKQLQKNEQKVSKALSQFCKELNDLVRNHNGVVIYAGGDDVLAMLPVPEALPVAVKLQQKYRQAFREGGEPTLQATSSAAILYAHCKTPLKSVLQEGHHLLDQVAKDQTGRDSLAIGIWKSSGVALTWSAPWKVVCDGNPDQAQTIFDGFKEYTRNGDQTIFSNQFLYKLKTLYEQAPMLTDDPEEHRQKLKRLITADYVRIMDSEKCNEDEINQRIENLMKVCFVAKRKDDNVELTGEFRVAGALVAQFLAQEGEGVVE